MPAARSRAMPSPATCGSGSSMPTTTRATPAAMIASAHGGVRPWCEHGSSVEASVAPRAAAPADRRATTSAWGPPGRLGRALEERRRPRLCDRRSRPTGSGRCVRAVGGELDRPLHQLSSLALVLTSSSLRRILFGRFVEDAHRRPSASGRHAAPSLPSGLTRHRAEARRGGTPSAPGFHRIGPARRRGFADSHRRSGLAPKPREGVSFVRLCVLSCWECKHRLVALATLGDETTDSSAPLAAALRSPPVAALHNRCFAHPAAAMRRPPVRPLKAPAQSVARRGSDEQLQGVGHDVEDGVEALDRSRRRARRVEHQRRALGCRRSRATAGRAGSPAAWPRPVPAPRGRG